MFRVSVKMAILPLFMVVIALMTFAFALPIPQYARADASNGKQTSTATPRGNHPQPTSAPGCHSNCGNPPPTYAVSTAAPQEWKVVVNKLNIRKDPRLNSDVIGVLYKGDHVTQSPQSNLAGPPQWIPILFDDNGVQRLGYVAAYNPDYPLEHYIEYP